MGLGQVHWVLERRKGRAIPIMVRDFEPADLRLRLMRIQYIDFRADPNTAARRLLEIPQRKHLQEPNGPVAEGFEDEETTVVGARETHLQISLVTGPQKGAWLDIRVRRDCIIGRGKEADVRVLDDCVSRRHARLSIASWKRTKQCLINDLESANGTIVNQCRIVAPKAITVGDVIDLGETRLRLDGVD